MPKQVADDDPDRPLTAQERRLAQILASDTGVALWEAGWRAGYCGADPEGAPPPAGSQLRKSLADSAGRARKRKLVQAEIQRLRNAAASDVVRAAKNGDPEAAAIVAARERMKDAAVAEQDAVDLAAALLDLKLRAAYADMGDFADWGEESVEVESEDGETRTVVRPFAKVRAKDDLTREQRQLIREIQFHPTCLKCGAEHERPGVTLKLEPRATFAQQATKQLGLEAPHKHEVTGKDGGPIQIQAGIGPDLALAIRHLIIGKPPAPVGGADPG